VPRGGSRYPPPRHRIPTKKRIPAADSLRPEGDSFNRDQYLAIPCLSGSGASIVLAAGSFLPQTL